MSIRCYWCDGDRFQGVDANGALVDIGSAKPDVKIVDYSCDWCGHLASEPNPRAGDPKETVEVLKDERDELRAQLEQCMGTVAEMAEDAKA